MVKTHPLHPIALFQQTRGFLVREGWDVGERGVPSKFGHLYSSTTPGEQTVYIDEQIDLALVHNQQLTRTLIIWTDPSSL